MKRLALGILCSVLVTGLVLSGCARTTRTSTADRTTGTAVVTTPPASGTVVAQASCSGAGGCFTPPAGGVAIPEKCQLDRASNTCTWQPARGAACSAGDPSVTPGASCR